MDLKSFAISAVGTAVGVALGMIIAKKLQSAIPMLG